MYKIRFNLSKGENYQKWQIKHGDEKYYLDPKCVSLIMEECILKNNKKIARKIFEGENKSVCAWILCSNLVIEKKQEITKLEKEIKYNPRKNPFWTTNSEENLDDKKFKKIVSKDKQLFVVLD